MRAFSYGDRLAQSQAASQQKFARFLTDQATASQEAQTGAIAQVAALQALVATQSADLGDRITEAQDGLTEALNGVQEIVNQLANDLPSLAADVAWETVIARASAPGNVGNDKTPDGRSIPGTPGQLFAVGDLMLTFGDVQPGWLLCAGQQVAIQDYPGLYSKLTDRFNNENTGPGMFRLPPPVSLGELSPMLKIKV